MRSLLYPRFIQRIYHGLLWMLFDLANKRTLILLVRVILPMLESHIVIPCDDLVLIKRLLTIAHFDLNGHRGISSIIAVLSRLYWWSDLKWSVKRFIEKCLHCCRAK